MLFGKTLLATVAALLTSPAFAQTEMPFALDWKFEGPAAPPLTQSRRWQLGRFRSALPISIR